MQKDEKLQRSCKSIQTKRVICPHVRRLTRQSGTSGVPMTQNVDSISDTDRKQGAKQHDGSVRGSVHGLA